jgi:phospholipase C
MVFATIFQLAVGNSFAAQSPEIKSCDNDTATPIKHVIVIIGENRSFDHVFATYVPKKPGEQVYNLLSEGIVKADGTPGPNFSKAAQKAAIDENPDAFLLDPEKTSFPKDVLPAPLVGGPKDSYVPHDNLTLARESENGLTPEGYHELVSGGTGQTSDTPDERIADVNAIPAGPFQLTNTAKTVSATTLTLQAPCTGSTKCGSSSIVASPTRPGTIPPAATQNCFPGLK